jgi:hypothetical protein
MTPPKLWDWMVAEWVRLPAPLSWVLWRALTRAEWTVAVQWRATFLDFDAPDRVLGRDLVEAFLGQIASPQQLITLCEQLLAEKRLLRRDAHQLEELLLAQTDASGQWKHQHRKGA